MSEPTAVVAAILAAAIGVALGLAGPRGGSGEPPETAVVSYTIAPGEDGSAIETVTVARRGGRHRLTLERTADRAKPQSETLTITDKEFAAIWAIVERERLAQFDPEVGSGAAPDYGDRALRVEVRATAEGEPKIHERRWNRPIKNQKRLFALVPALARMARDKGKAVKLENFRP